MHYSYVVSSSHRSHCLFFRRSHFLNQSFSSVRELRHGQANIPYVEDPQAKLNERPLYRASKSPLAPAKSLDVKGASAAEKLPPSMKVKPSVTGARSMIFTSGKRQVLCLDFCTHLGTSPTFDRN
jgi:hypothetical protein